MQRIRQLLFVASALTGLALVGIFINSRQAIAQGPPNGLAVRIVDPLPVPVSGSVGVTGPITVSLSAGSHVRVDNTVTNPVRVRNVNDALQPAQAGGSCVADAGLIGCGVTLYTVPAGKRLVIEYASINSCSLPGQIALMDITTTVGGRSVAHSLTSTRAATSPGSSSIGCNGVTPSSVAATGEQVHLYADAETPVLVDVTRDSAVGNGAFSFSISGYLVDVPLAP
jgi:hypothetical protein